MSQLIRITENSCKSLIFAPEVTGRNQKFSSSGKTVYAFHKDEKDENKTRVPFLWAYENYKTLNDKRNFKKVSHQKKEEYSLNEEQRADANKVIQKLSTGRVCTLCLGTGGGKTATSCCITTSVKLFTMVLLPMVVLLDQWKLEFEKFTTAKTHIVEPGVEIPEDADVLICYMERWSHIPLEIRNQVGFLIIDESPLFCNQIGTDAMLSVAPMFILCLSATPSRSRDGMYSIMEAFVGTEEVKNKKKKDIQVTRIKTQYKAEKVKKNGILVWATYIQSLLYNPERNQRILEGVAADLDYGRKILVMTTEKKHVRLLHEMFIEQDINSDWLCGTKKKYKCCDVLVANTQKCGIGFDDANSCVGFDGKKISIIWLVSEIANPENIEQILGRSRDSNPWFRQIVDDESLSETHWQICRKVFVERGGSISHVHWK